jgi:3-oxoacyl-[acyl-carrier protein] reductase
MATTTPPYPQGHGLLTDKIVVITAAAGAGIGGATARRCLEEGASVVISDAHERRLKESLDALGTEFGPDRVAAQACDVIVEEQVQALYAFAVARFGRIDVAVNNAGLGGTADLVDMADEAWDRVIDITLNGTMRCTRAALRIMRDQGTGGAIVNNASVIGWRAQKGQSHYAAAKAGVMALTRCAALEAAEHGIRINAVSPSLAMHPHLVKVTSEELLNELTAREAFGRYAEPWEVANVIIFLAGQYSSYMTGEVVSVSSQHA